MEDITDAHANRICKDFKIKKLGEYHDFFVQKIHYCYLMYLKILEICVLKYMSLVLQNFFHLLD